LQKRLEWSTIRGSEKIAPATAGHGRRGATGRRAVTTRRILEGDLEVALVPVAA
jgi:hypothetical protein